MNVAPVRLERHDRIADELPGARDRLRRHPSQYDRVGTRAGSSCSDARTFDGFASPAERVDVRVLERKRRCRPSRLLARRRPVS